MTRNNASCYMGLIFLIFSSVIFWKSLQFPFYLDTRPGPGFFPLWLSAGLFIASLAYTIGSLKKSISFSEILPKGSGLWNIIILFAATIFFLLTVEYIGFVVDAGLLLFALLFKSYKWYISIIISMSVSISLFLVFHTFLEIPLPVNVFGW